MLVMGGRSLQNGLSKDKTKRRQVAAAKRRRKKNRKKERIIIKKKYITSKGWLLKRAENVKKSVRDNLAFPYLYSSQSEEPKRKYHIK